MKTIAKAKVNKGRRAVVILEEEIPQRKVLTIHGLMPAPRLRFAVPGDDDQDPQYEAKRNATNFVSRGGGFGMTQDMRTALTLLAAHQRAVGQYTVRGQREGWKEIAKNELIAFTEAILEANKPAADGTPSEAQKENLARYQEAWEAKQSGNMSKMIALCELRKETINNYARARGHFLEMFFEEVTLGQNDSAYITNETMYPQAVFYMAQDGKLRCQRAIAALSNWLVPLYFVSSEKYGYQIEDIQHGNITAPAMRTVDIAFDIAAQLDWNAFLALTGLLPRSSTNGGVNGVFGNFVTAISSPSTAAQLLTFNISPRVQGALLPTTNMLAPWPDAIPAGLSQGSKGAGYLIDSAGNPVIGMNAVHSILRYCDQFANVFMDGPLRPTGLLIVPAIDAASILSTITPTAAKPSMIAEGLLSNYTRFEYGGIVWTMMPDVTIPRGTIYGVLNKPVGKNFVKPSMDREFVTTNFEDNWEDRWYRRTQGIYIPVQNTPRAVSVSYM